MGHDTPTHPSVCLGLIQDGGVDDASPEARPLLLPGSIGEDSGSPASVGATTLGTLSSEPEAVPSPLEKTVLPPTSSQHQPANAPPPTQQGGCRHRPSAPENLPPPVGPPRAPLSLSEPPASLLRDAEGESSGEGSASSRGSAGKADRRRQVSISATAAHCDSEGLLSPTGQ